MSINVDLLLKVKAKILANPESFYMGDWIMKGEDVEVFVASTRYRPAPPCGTIACIAGWAVLIDNPNSGLYDPVDDEPIDVRAARLLGLEVEIRKEPYFDFKWSPIANLLFYSSGWPPLIRERYRDASCERDYVKMAQVAADRIDHFIATDGAA